MSRCRIYTVVVMGAVRSCGIKARLRLLCRSRLVLRAKIGRVKLVAKNRSASFRVVDFVRIGLNNHS